MSNYIDNEIVTLEFDNSDFEKKVKQSRNTLSQLKADLKNSTIADSATDALSRAAELAGSAGNSIGNSFAKGINGILGTAKRKFNEEIVNVFIGGAKRITNSLLFEQNDAGWSKYNEKIQNTQTIMNATGKSVEEVDGYLSQLMRFSDETSYSFTEMTSALSTMTSTGADINNIIPLIMGVAEATAYAGKSGREFHHVMENLTQSYSTGYLTNKDWISVEGMNVNSKQLIKTLIDAGVQLEKIKDGDVTLENFRETLSKKWADRDVMELAFGNWAALMQEAISATDAGKFKTVQEALDVLGENYDDYVVKGAKASQSAKTFQEAVDATKDAVSSGWMRSYEMIFGNYEEALDLWSNVTDKLWQIFAQGGEDRNDTLFDAFANNWDILSAKITDTGIEFEVFENSLGQVLADNGYDVEQLIEDHGSLAEAFTQGKVSAELLKQALDNLASGEAIGNASAEEFTGKWKDYQKVVNDFAWGKFGSGEKAIQKLTDAGYNWEVVQIMLEKTGANLQKHTLNHYLTEEEFNASIEEYITLAKEKIELDEEQQAAIQELADAAKDASTPLGELMDNFTRPSGKELLKDTILNFLDTIINIKDRVGEAMNTVFGGNLSGLIYKGLTAINNFSKSILKASEGGGKFKDALVSVFKAFEPVISVLRDFASSALSFLVDRLADAGTAALTFFEAVGNGLSQAVTALKDSGVLEEIFQKINSAITACADTIKNIYNSLKESPVVQRMLSGLTTMVEKFLGINTEFEAAGANITAGLNSGLASGLASILITVANIANGILTAICTILGIHSPAKATEELGEYTILGFIEGLMNGANTLSEAVTGIFGIIGESFTDPNNPVMVGLRAFGQNILDKLQDGSLLNDLYVAAMGLAFLKIIGGMLTALQSFAKPFEAAGRVIDGFKDLGAAVKGFVDECKGTVTAFKNILTGIGNTITKFGDAAIKKATADTIKQIAIMLGVIFAGVWLISTIPQEKIYTSVGIIAGMIVLVGVLLGYMTTLTERMSKAKLDVSVYTRLTLALLTFSVAIGVLAIVARALNNVEGWSIVKLGAMMAFLGAITWELSWLADKVTTTQKAVERVKGLAKAMLQIAIAMGAMALVLKLASTFKLADILPITAFVGGFMLLTFALTKLNNAIKGDFSQMSSGIFKMAGALGAMIIIAHMASSLRNANFGAIVAFATGFLGFAFLLNKVADGVDGEKLTSLSKTLNSMVFAIGMMALIMTLLGKADPIGLIQGAVAIFALEVLIKYLISVVKSADSNMPKVTKTLLGISFAIALLSLVAVALGKVKTGTLLKGGLALTALSGIIWLLITVVKTAEKDAPKIGRTLLAISAAIAILAMIVPLLGIIKLQTMLQGILGVTLLSLVIEILVKTTQKASKDAPRIMGMLTSMAICIAVLGGLAVLMGIIPLPFLAKGVVAVTILSLAVAAMIWATKDAKDAKKNITALIAVIVSITVCAALLSMIPWQSLLPAAAGLSVMMVAFAYMAKQLSGIQTSGKNALALVIMVGVLAAIAGALFFLRDIPWTTLAAGAIGMAAVMLALAYSMKIIQNTGDLKAAGSLALLAASLTLIAIALRLLVGIPFGTLIVGALALGVLAVALAFASKIMQTAALGALALGGLFVLLATSVVILSIGLDLLGPALAGVGSGIAALVTSVSGVSDHIQAFKDVMITAGGALVTFAIQIAIGLVVLAGAIWVLGAAGSASGIGLMMLGGSMIAIGLGIAALAVGVFTLGAAFASAGLGVESFISAIALGMVEAKAAFEIVKTGSVEAGTSMIEGFKSAIDGKKEDLKASAEQAGEATAEGLENGSSNSSSFIDKLLGGLTDGIGSVGDKLGGLFDNVNLGEKATAVMDGASAAITGSIDTAAGEVNTSLNSDEKMGWSASLGKFLSFGGSAGDNVVSGITEKLGTFDLTSVLPKDVDLSSMFGNFDLSSMLGGASVDMSSITGALEGVDTAGAMTNMASGITTGGAEVTAAAEVVAGDVQGKFEDVAGNAEGIGENIDAGLQTGIERGASELYKKAEEIAKKIAETIADAFEVKSPSRLMMRMGKYVDQGLEIGMDKNAYRPVRAADKMATQVIDATSGAFSTISDLFNSDYDLAPTIRPVLDLTNIQNGANAITSTLSLPQTMHANAVISSEMASNKMLEMQRELAGISKDFSNEIADLRTDIAKMNETDHVTNMYVDGRRLASAIARPMNRQLNVLAERG